MADTSFEMTITCPACGQKERVSVPTNQCVLVHECTGCGAHLRREPGSCCVFCSHPADASAGAATPS